MDKKMISIRVHPYKQPDLEVVVDAREPIQNVLKQYFNYSMTDLRQLLVIHKNLVISPIFTFLFYDIKDGDVFHIIPTSQTAGKLKLTNRPVRRMSETPPSLSQIHEVVQYFDMNHDSDTFHMVYDILTIPMNSREIARLKDCKIMRIESDGKLQRKTENNFFFNCDTPDDDQTDTNLPPKDNSNTNNNKPSTTELPHRLKHKDPPKRADSYKWQSE